MTIQQLEYLLKIVECGSITKAAQQLFLSQPSLTKSIMNLENEYGIKVFARTAKGIEITPEGKDFIYYARNIITSINSMEKQFSSNTLQKKFVLSVASQQLDFLYDLLLCLYDQNKEKSIHFNIVEANRSHVVQSVLSGDVNIGIIVRSSADSKAFTWRLAAKNLEATIIDNSGVYVSMGPKSPYYNNEKISFAELEGQLHAVLDMEDEAIQDLYMNQIDNHINLQRVLFFNTINACKKFLLYTDAHLYTPKWVLNFSEELKYIRFLYLPPEMKLSLQMSLSG